MGAVDRLGRPNAGGSKSFASSFASITTAHMEQSVSCTLTLGYGTNRGPTWDITADCNYEGTVSLCPSRANHQCFSLCPLGNSHSGGTRASSVSGLCAGTSRNIREAHTHEPNRNQYFQFTVTLIQKVFISLPNTFTWVFLNMMK